MNQQNNSNFLQNFLGLQNQLTMNQQAEQQLNLLQMLQSPQNSILNKRSSPSVNDSNLEAIVKKLLVNQMVGQQNQINLMNTNNNQANILIQTLIAQQQQQLQQQQQNNSLAMQQQMQLVKQLQQAQQRASLNPQSLVNKLSGQQSVKKELNSQKIEEQMQSIIQQQQPQQKVDESKVSKYNIVPKQTSPDDDKSSDSTLVKDEANQQGKTFAIPISNPDNSCIVTKNEEDQVQRDKNNEAKMSNDNSIPSDFISNQEEFNQNNSSGRRRSSRVKSKSDELTSLKREFTREEKLNLVDIFVQELKVIFKSPTIRFDKAKEMLKRKDWDVSYAIFTVKKNYPFYTKFFGIKNH